MALLAALDMGDDNDTWQDARMPEVIAYLNTSSVRVPRQYADA